ncbi:hypothetical protein P3439_23160 [Vibrio parahaemolyticus]|nr:hypothetical protein [Vibrio parahaemolyticus]
MSKTVEEVLEFELKHEFHFVEVPDNVPEFIWKNANGEFIFMDSMGLDHLKASIGKVNRAITYLDNSNRHKEVKQALLPPAKVKLQELKDMFAEKNGHLMSKPHT